MTAGLTPFDKAILALLTQATEVHKAKRQRIIAFIASDHYGVPYANRGQRAAVSRSLWKMSGMGLVGQFSDRDPYNPDSIAREVWWLRRAG